MSTKTLPCYGSAAEEVSEFIHIVILRKSRTILCFFPLDPSHEIDIVVTGLGTTTLSIKVHTLGNRLIEKCYFILS